MTRFTRAATVLFTAFIAAACAAPPDPAVPTSEQRTSNAGSDTPATPVPPAASRPAPSAPAPPATTTTTVTPRPTQPPETTVPDPDALVLDDSGSTIPPNNYPIPDGAVFMSPSGADANSGGIASPVRSLRRAVALAPAGGTIVLRGGDHRTWHSNHDGTQYAIVSKSLTIQGYPGEQAWLNGADVVTGWTAAGSGRWSRDWSTPTFCDGRYYERPPTSQAADNTGPCSHRDAANDPAHPLAGDPQAVFVDGVTQRQVASVADVGPGTFHYDWGNRRLTIGTNPSGRSIEVTARPVALVLGNQQSYTVRGVGFRRFASNEYSNLTQAALYIGANRSTVENVVFTQNSGWGLAYSRPRNGSSVTSSVFAHNGFNGLGANGSAKVVGSDDFRIESNVFNANNASRFGRNCTISCAAANVKLAHMQGVVVRDNVFQNAQGEAMGFWCDLACSDAVIVNNLVRDNGKHGIYYEVSSDGIIASNLVHGNGEVGIAVAAADTKVYNNTVLIDPDRSSKAQGVWVYDDPRLPSARGGIGPNTAGVELANNVMSGRRGVLLKAVDGTGGAGNTRVEEYFELLDNNLYHHGGQNIINWRHHDPSIGQYFRSPSAFHQATGWEGAGHEFSTAGPELFVDGAAGDFRLRAAQRLPERSVTLPGDVAVALGVTAGTAPGHGALRWARIVS